jgi:hypothetical protein
MDLNLVPSVKGRTQIYGDTVQGALEKINTYLRGMKWRESCENCVMRSSLVCTLHEILLG